MPSSLDSAVFELDYVLDRKDLRDYESYSWSRSRVYVGLVHALFCLMLVAFGLLVPFLMHQTVLFFGLDWPPQLNLLYVVGAAASLFFGYQTVKSRYGNLMNAVKSNDHDDLGFDEQLALGKRHLTVSQSNIAIRSPAGETVREWSGVKSIETAGDLILIYSDVGFVIPRRAFSSDGELQTFVSAVTEWHARAGDAD